MQSNFLSLGTIHKRRPHKMSKINPFSPCPKKYSHCLNSSLSVWTHHNFQKFNIFCKKVRTSASEELSRPWASAAGAERTVASPWIFIHGTDKVEGGLMVLFLVLFVFLLPPPGNFSAYAFTHDPLSAKCPHWTTPPFDCRRLLRTAPCSNST